MSKLRPSTQIAQDGAVTGNALVWDGSKWVPGSAGISEQELGTRVGSSSADVDGTIDVVYTTVYGIDGTGQTYFDAAGAAAGDEAVLSVGADGGLYLTKVTT